MHVIENFRDLDAHAGELVDVEEAPVVPVVRGDAEVCDPPVLRLDERLERR